MKTFVQKKEEVTRDWFLVDATNQVLGRMATRIAKILMGKHKPVYTPHVDTGDHVIVINAEKVMLTGRKMEQKNYYSHSGYPGGIKVRPVKRVIKENPEFIIKNAVRLMLPKNRLGRKMLTKLKVYRGESHPHQAQMPKKLDVKTFQKVAK